MKNFKSFVFAFFIAGLFYSPTQAQSAAETPQFNFPLEVGNVWVYSYRTPAPASSCFISGCDYQRWEVMSTETTPEKGTCGIISAKQVYLWPEQGWFELCMNDNRLIRYPASDRGWLILNGAEESEILADFNKAAGDVWLTGTIYEAGTELWRELYARNGARYAIRAFFLLESEQKETAYVGGHIANHSYEDGVGFRSHGFYETSNYVDLTGSFLNGVLNGDTTFVVPTSIEHDPDYEDGPSLLSAYPNPFNPSTVVGFQLSVFGDVSVKVHDLLGREVAILVNEGMMPGQHSVTFDASGLPSGMYVIVLESEGRRDVRKITLLK
jgi:hypothetical protein